MIVLDASAAIEALHGPKAEAVRDVLAEADDLHAPQLLLLEVASVLRRAVLTQRATPAIVEASLASIEQLDVTLHGHRHLMPMITRMLGSITAYDASYVAVAAALDAPLLTMDERLARAADRWCDTRVIA